MQTTGLRSSISEISKEKNIDKQLVIKSLESAYKSFARKKINMVANMEAEYNEDSDQMNIYQYKTVVDKVKNNDLEIALSAAKEMDENTEVGDELGINVSAQLKFSRADILLIKQMFIHSVQKEIKDKLVNEFSSRKGEIISGIVKKVDQNYYLIDLGSTEAYLSKRECIGDEKFQVKDKVQAILTEVESGARGAELQLSRTSHLFVIKLMEQEISEIGDGLVEITKIAREPGFRTKILLKSKETSLNPVQLVVGNKGFRIQNIANQLNGERVNVYLDKSQDQMDLLKDLVKDINLVQIINYSDKVILVPESEDLGKLVGTRGSNLKTIASIIGKVVDVVSLDNLKKFKEQVASEYHKTMNDLTVQALINHHLTSLDKIKSMSPADLSKLIQIPQNEVGEFIKKLEEAKLEKIELKAEAFAQPKTFTIPDKHRKSSTLDAEKRLRDEIRSNFNLKTR